MPEMAELRLSGPMTGEQKLGERLSELSLVGNANPPERKARRDQTGRSRRAGLPRMLKARSRAQILKKAE
jgi:hypothetical protein